MQFRQNSVVKSATGETIGYVSHFVIDPRNNEISHLIVEKGFLFLEDRIVPIDAVATATANEIVLAPGKGGPEDFPLFDHSYFVRSGEYSENPDGLPGLAAYYYYPPVALGGGVPVAAPVAAAIERDMAAELPDYSVAVRKGADVYTSDGKLAGQVAEVVVSEDTNRVTHIVMSQGLLLKTHKLLPAHWIAEMANERVDLGTSSSVIEDLPDFQP